jgi:hypothetical protein
LKEDLPEQFGNVLSTLETALSGILDNPKNNVHDFATKELLRHPTVEKIIDKLGFVTLGSSIINYIPDTHRLTSALTIIRTAMRVQCVFP